MARKHHKPEEIVGKLRQVEVVVGQGKPVAEAIRAIGVTEPTYYRWRAEYGGLKLDQVRRLKQLGHCPIFCAGGRLSSSDDEPFAEDHGELAFRLTPFPRRPFPFVCCVIEHEV